MSEGSLQRWHFETLMECVDATEDQQVHHDLTHFVFLLSTRELLARVCVEVGAISYLVRNIVKYHDVAAALLRTSFSALANLLKLEEGASHFVQLNGFKFLLAMVANNQMENQEEAARAVYYATQSKDNLKKFLDEGGLPKVRAPTLHASVSCLCLAVACAPAACAPAAPAALLLLPVACPR